MNILIVDDEMTVLKTVYSQLLGMGLKAGRIDTANSAREAKERMDSGDDIIILDVRTQDEYEESHIPGAILIPNETIGTEMPEQLPDAGQEILVYCRSGNRSAQAAKKLVEAGYTQIYDFGGIMDWPYETVSGK